MLLIRYLVIPLRLDRLTRGDWAPILDNLKRKLDGWKGEYLSLGGMTVLINSVLTTMPIFIMSIRELPWWVLNRIDRIWRRVLWQGIIDSDRKYYLVPWGQICRSKE